MRLMLHLVRLFGRDNHAATAVEYALLAMLVGVALVGSVFIFGGELFEFFNRIGNELSNT